MKKALITGVTGQDGSYLAEFLLQKGYEVYGLRRAASTFNTERIDHIIQFPHSTGGQLKLIYGDLTDSNNLDKILAEVKPDEIYNLGAQSHVHLSFQVPEYTAQIDAIGVLRLLDGLKNNCPNARFYQASTSELFGKAKEIPQSENTPFYPRSPYASAKLYAYWTTVNYREAYNLFACNGILFNHESPRRGKTFVTRKITQAVAKIYYGLQEKLYLGNLDAKRDWGYAPEYVEAMWLMLQQETPDDFIISSGETHTVREFCEKAFSLVGINLEWIGEGINEKGIDKKTRNTIVEIDARYFRPTEVDVLLGDNSKARTKLGWSPKTKFDQLIDIMVQEDLREYKSAKPVAVEAPKTIGRMLYKQIDSCRICGNTRLIDVLDLGIFGLSGVFPLPNEKVPEGPLAIVRCGEGGCGLLQLKHNYDLELLYGENYGYRSGLNNSMVKHLTEIVRKIESRVDINMGDIVLDIGSNDSTMLQKYQAKDLVLVGVDPTAEKFKEYYPNNIVRIPEFFSADTIKQRFSQKVKVVTSIAMFYDLEHPFEIVKQISEVLADDGVWVLEQSYMPHMLDNTSYDTICHEHLEYYSLKSLKWMFDKAGLKIIDVSFNDTNGASFLIMVSKKDSKYREATETIEDILKDEEARGLSSNLVYEDFKKRVENSRRTLINFLRERKNSGEKVIGYGASTKGNVILQYCGITSDLMSCIAEVNDYKFGRVTPTTGIPIVSEAEARKDSPEYMVVLPWHFRENFIRKEGKYMDSGGSLVFPLPRLEIVR